MTFHSKSEEAVAERYAAAGYEIRSGSEFGRVKVPAGYVEPDLIALRGDERIVIEVLSPNARRESLEHIADAAKSRGWAFHVVRSPKHASGDHGLRDLTPQESRHRVELAKSIGETTNDWEVALLIAWTAFEAKLSACIRNFGVDTLNRGPNDLLKQGVSLGIIEESDEKDLADIIRIRNAVAHGRHIEGNYRSSIDRLTLLIDHLHDEPDHAVE